MVNLYGKGGMVMLEHKKICKMLTSLEKYIDQPLEMIICGGAAAILAHKMKRNTADVDLVFLSYRPPDFEKIKAEIAEEFGVDINWLNEGAKGYADYLPNDFQKRLIRINLKSKLITAWAIGRVDLIIMKLASFRPEDLEDIDNLGIRKEDIKIIKPAIQKISSFDKKAALRMKLFLEERGL